MRLPARRLLASAAILVLLALAVSAAEPGTKYVTVDESTCWECHSNWAPALEAITVAIPPASVGAPPGTPFTFTVQLQNTWRSDVTFISPTIDISKAPSLVFAGGHKPDSNRTTITITPGNNLTSVQSASTQFTVPPGASYLKFGAEPQTTDPVTGPDITLTIVGPTGQTVASVNNATRGGAENYELTPSDLLTFGSGVYRVGARYVPLDPDDPGIPAAGRQSIDITEEARFEIADLRVLALPRIQFIGPSASTLQSWDLVAKGPPDDGEHVTVYANVTGYYDHINPVSTGDYGNFTTNVRSDLKLVDGKATLVYESSGNSVRPAVVNGATMSQISEAVGYAAAFLLISSILSGGMFGRASRRAFNTVFGSAKRRVAFHNFLSYGLTVAAIVHTLIFVGRLSQDYDITWGLFFGGIAILSMLGLGVTGALQVPMIRKWNYGTWRWTHYGMTVAAILFTVVHMLLDGRNFGSVQEFFGWQWQTFPFDPPA